MKKLIVISLFPWTHRSSQKSLTLWSEHGELLSSFQCLLWWDPDQTITWQFLLYLQPDSLWFMCKDLWADLPSIEDRMRGSSLLMSFGEMRPSRDRKALWNTQSNWKWWVSVEDAGGGSDYTPVLLAWRLLYSHGGNKKRSEKYFNLMINRSIRIYLNISVVLDSHGLLLNIISRKHRTVYKETVQIGGCCSADTMYKKNK